MLIRCSISLLRSMNLPEIDATLIEDASDQDYACKHYTAHAPSKEVVSIAKIK